MEHDFSPAGSPSYIAKGATFHYFSQLQTWSKIWSQTCGSVSQAGQKPAANLMISPVMCDMT